MRIGYDPRKQAATLRERGLDFENAAEVFAGRTLYLADDRFDYGEAWIVTISHLRGRMVVVVWTQRGAWRHFISMRKANDREQARFGQRFEES